MKTLVKPKYNGPTVVVIAESLTEVLVNVRTGTAVTTIALANQSAVYQLRTALTSAWALGFADGQDNPEFDCHGTAKD